MAVKEANLEYVIESDNHPRHSYLLFCSLTGDGHSVHPVMMRTTAPLPLYRVMPTTYRIITNIAPGIPASALMSTVIRSIGT
ncbi:MAG: hypothetical protein WCE81_05380 [Halobacteriota archaeon]